MFRDQKKSSAAIDDSQDPICFFSNKENKIFEDGEKSGEMSKIRSQMFTTVSLMIAYVQLDV